MEANSDRGTPFGALSCVFTVFVLVAYSLRIYSRTFLTRSLGSDDFSLVFSVITTTAGEVGAWIQISHGMGRHRQYINDQDYAITNLWATIAWLLAFISYFFLRASIMLFVLRLLPSYKVWQHRVIYVAFFLNFAISVVGLVTYGIQCVPFTAIWQEQLKTTAKCFNKDTVVMVNQINGALSCLIDIITALIPEFLLWNVTMKPKTKRILNIIFGLGILTAACSIGRAATINKGAQINDSNWRLMPSRWWAMFEEKWGIIFACAPALRQLYGYYKRVGTIKPTRHRQPAEQDFVKMRGRITWRDVFWYTRQAAVPSKGQESESDSRPMVDSQGSKKPEVDKHPVAAAVQGVSKPDTGNRDVEAAFRGTTDRQTQEDVVAEEAHTSRFTIWQRKFRDMFNTTAGSSEYKRQSGGSTEMSNNPRRKTSRRNLLGKHTTHTGHISEGPTYSQQETERLDSRYRQWGILPKQINEKSRNKDTFLASQSAGQSATRTQMDGDNMPSRDYDLADILTQPVARPATTLKV